MVNGTLGRVIDFLTTLEASQRGIKIGIPLGGDDAKKWKGEEEAGRKGDSHVNPLQDIPQELLRSPRKWPVVQFSTGEEQLPMCCVPLSFEVMNADGEVEARRDQVCALLCFHHPRAQVLSCRCLLFSHGR
ncbi:hypothetical protein BDW22DRAFT_1129553 [Trametopsis cervina]|nr:hypothetical protein BDW22DRAFT_1129553 [Trametopsis cervina]